MYNPFDIDRNCGDGPVHCPSDLVFHRVPLEPRVTADQTGELPGVWLTYNAVDPATIVPSDPAKAGSYFSAGPGRVGQSVVYVARSVNDGATWSIGPVETPAQGHQFFPDIDAHAGELGVVWQDNRGPTYDVQYPIGNTRDAQGRAISAGREIVNTFLASWTGTAWSPAQRVSTVGHQSQYEMFSSRDLPFHGDYNWISLAERPDGTVIGYMSWTDNRDVVVGADPRETQAQGGFNDGFDVLQCRIDLGAPATPANLPRRPARPLRRPVHRRQLRQRRWPGPKHLRHQRHLRLTTLFRSGRQAARRAAVAMPRPAGDGEPGHPTCVSITS